MTTKMHNETVYYLATQAINAATPAEASDSPTTAKPPPGTTKEIFLALTDLINKHSPQWYDNGKEKAKLLCRGCDPALVNHPSPSWPCREYVKASRMRESIVDYYLK